MNEELEKLQKIGHNQIHKDTHIALHHIKQLLSEDFEALNKVQLLGFISILEREYHLDLHDTKKNINDFFINQPVIVGKSHSVFVVANKKKDMKTIYLSLVLVIFLIVAFLSITYTTQESEVLVGNKIIEKVKQEIVSEKKIILKEPTAKINIKKEILPIQKIELKEESPIVQKKIVKPVTEVVKPKKKEIIEANELLITPRSKVWIGYINLKTKKKNQKVIKNSITLKEDSLIVLGHSHIYLKINEKKFSYKTKGSLRLLYRDGTLKKISLEEFKKLNSGRKW